MNIKTKKTSIVNVLFSKLLLEEIKRRLLSLVVMLVSQDKIAKVL